MIMLAEILTIARMKFGSPYTIESKVVIHRRMWDYYLLADLVLPSLIIRIVTRVGHAKKE